MSLACPFAQFLPSGEDLRTHRQVLSKYRALLMAIYRAEDEK